MYVLVCVRVYLCNFSILWSLSVCIYVFYVYFGMCPCVPVYFMHMLTYIPTHYMHTVARTSRRGVA